MSQQKPNSVDQTLLNLIARKMTYIVLQILVSFRLGSRTGQLF
ncbi:hypothetical protein HanPI659440_Chr06g0244211 [Helianthus annuus]|nr:hypothetical protein HanPI659440_Chr06g0244211 [Helianthus annuus]